jgi:beta-glucosidase
MQMTKHISIILILFLIGSSCQDNAVYKDRTKSIEERVGDILSRLTLEEKISLTHGNSKFTVAGIERLSVPELSMSDGPHGVREEIERDSWNPAGWTTDSASYLPTGIALASTWNTDLAYKFGQVLGSEARARKKDVILGPGINLMRTPLNGRNFEYMGEDPYLISKMVVPVIKGIQDQDVAACIKHYAFNNQEYERGSINVDMGDRTLHEIYLRGYEAAVKDGGARTVMAAYNKFRGEYCAENKFLLTDILKNDWDFKGAVISDWSAVHSTIPSALAGMDIEMGTNADNYNEYFFGDSLVSAVKSGKVPESVVDDMARRELRVLLEVKALDPDQKKGSFASQEHFDIARKIADEAIVLLKNDNILPLEIGELKSIAVIGDNATRKHASGGGSSGIKALYEITPLEGLRNRVGDKLKINYSPGYTQMSEWVWGRGLNDRFDPKEASKLRKEAAEAAKKSDVAIIFAGLNHHFDTEATDRKDLKLPYEQDKLIQEVSKANPKTIVVLISGSPVEMPWANKIHGIVQAWYAGMEGGNAMADVLFGDVNPSGKLCCTFPRKLADSPAHAMGAYPGADGSEFYKEGIFVGYRYFDSNNINPLFAFGHGLSYTVFRYSGIKLNKSEDDNIVTALVKVKNVGSVAGAEVAQLYIEDIESSVPRPQKELKAFKKINLDPGEEQVISFPLNRDAFSFYDAETSMWKAEPGVFRILVGSSSRDIRARTEFELEE